MNPWPISPLTQRELGFAVKTYDFTGLTAGDLADLPNLEAAIDSTLSDFGTSIADQAVLIGSMAGDLDDLGNVIDEIDSDNFEQIAADLAGIASTGDSLLSNIGALIP